MRSSGLLVALFTLMLVMPLCARAQNGLYVEYGGATLHNSSQPDQYGPTVGIYLENKTLQAIRAGVDFRGFFLSGSNNTSLNTGLAGLRVSIHPKPLPITPYGELMVGISSRSLGSPVTADFATAGILGVDYTLAPHLAWRVLEFSYSRVNASTAFNPVAFSTGIVVRLS